MKKTVILFFVSSFILSPFALLAQDSTQINNSINHQFEVLLNSSNNYKNYKVVPTSDLLQLQQNTQVEIGSLKNEITQFQTQIETQENHISELKNALEASQKNLKEASAAKEEIILFGVPINKSTYQTITWGIIILLAIALFIFIYKFKNSHVQTRNAQRNLNETEAEFEEYKKTALEKQQKLGRMLQDERNKLPKNGSNK